MGRKMNEDGEEEQRINEEQLKNNKDSLIEYCKLKSAVSLIKTKKYEIRMCTMRDGTVFGGWTSSCPYIISCLAALRALRGMWITLHGAPVYNGCICLWGEAWCPVEFETSVPFIDVQGFALDRGGRIVDAHYGLPTFPIKDFIHSAGSTFGKYPGLAQDVAGFFSTWKK